jgi:hypothetical protein
MPFCTRRFGRVDDLSSRLEQFLFQVESTSVSATEIARPDADRLQDFQGSMMDQFDLILGENFNL